MPRGLALSICPGAVARGRGVGTRRWQAGAISVMAVILLATIGVAAMISVDVGYVFYSQRQLQKMVDLAAVSGAQQLKRADEVPVVAASVLASVQGAASQNGYPAGVANGCADATAGGADGMTSCLGLWDPGNPANGDSTRHFNAAYDPARVTPNAVRVQATLTLPVLFVFPGSGGRQLRAEAIAAASPPVASFSVGSGLLDVDTANGFLSALLGPNVVVKFSAADWSGLVNTQITLEQLRLAAGAGTIDQLLGLQLSLPDFDALVLKAAGRDALLSTALGSPPTTLGAGGAGAVIRLSQLLDLGLLAPAASSAAEVGLNVATLLGLGAQVARGDMATELNLVLSLPGELLGVKTMLKVIQPPQFAVGPVRQTSGPIPWATSAVTGQLGVGVIAQAKPLDLSVPLLPPLKLELRLPLFVKAAQASAALTGLQCSAASADRRATLQVQPQLATVCLANDAGTDCATGPATLGVIPLVGTLKATATSSPVSFSGTNLTLAPATQSQVAAQSPLADLVLQLVASLQLQLDGGVGGIAQPLVDAVLAAVKPVVKLGLAPLVDVIDDILVHTLASLGIQLGNATVWMHGIDCNNAELVY